MGGRTSYEVVKAGIPTKPSVRYWKKTARKEVGTIRLDPDLGEAGCQANTVVVQPALVFSVGEQSRSTLV